jgi:16S rRNA G966 N2-methylase RsmD
MMEKVRGAVFSILQSYLSSPGGLPAGSRWLDLFSGTGAVGLEGMSRGADEVRASAETRIARSPLIPHSSPAHTHTARFIALSALP